MRISLIVAKTDKHVIGLDGGMPWRISEDLKFFKTVTMGHPIIMGRKTYESIGGALPGRTNIVVTRNKDFQADDADVIHSHDDALAGATAFEELWGAEDRPNEVFVIGGAEIYAQAIDGAGRIYVTEVHRELPGDAYFPEFNPDDWAETDRQDREPESEGGPAYSFVILDRKA